MQEHWTSGSVFCANVRWKGLVPQFRVVSFLDDVSIYSHYMISVQIVWVKRNETLCKSMMNAGNVCCYQLPLSRQK